MQRFWQEFVQELSPLEIAAVVTTLVNVVLTIRNRIACWPWGIASCALYAFIFWQSKLYSSLGLQVLYYLPMQFYGWHVWLRYGPTQNDDLPISVLTPARRAAWFLVNIPLAFVLGGVMHHFTPATDPFVDALVTAISVTGQYLMTHKYLENWWMWVIVNVLYTFYLLPRAHLWFSTGLYFVLLCLAFRGLIDWKRLRIAQGIEARAQ